MMNFYNTPKEQKKEHQVEYWYLGQVELCISYEDYFESVPEVIYTGIRSMSIQIQNDPYIHPWYTAYISMEICGH